MDRGRKTVRGLVRLTPREKKVKERGGVEGVRVLGHVMSGNPPPPDSD